jgi:polyphosphate glucokinase
VIEKEGLVAQTKRKPLQGQPKSEQPLRTLAIDIGASGIKFVVLNELAEPLTERVRVETPEPATPDAVISAIMAEARRQKSYDRISVGFPCVIRDGIVKGTPRLDPGWKDFHLARILEQKLQRPVRVVNDADMQGLGAISGTGVELVLTLGTGVGSSLFSNGMLVPNLEVGWHKLSNAALEKIGKKRWNRRLLKAVRQLESLFHFDRLYLGGGNSRHVKVDKLPAHVTVISNLNGLVGGVALWGEHGIHAPHKAFATHAERPATA